MSRAPRPVVQMAPWLLALAACPPAASRPPPAVTPLAAPAAPEPARADLEAYQESLKEAMAAHERKDFASFLEHSLSASRAAPDSPRALYNVACGYSLTGRKDEAVAAVSRMADRKTYFNVDADPDFDAVRDTPGFKAARARLEALKAPIHRSSVAFTLPQEDLIPEGIAHDPASGAFFVSSVHRRSIVRVDPGGQTSELVKEGQDGLFAVLGIQVDPARRSLWACSAAVPEMKGHREDDRGKTGLFEFDLTTGQLRRKLLLDEPGVGHGLNDLAIDPRGDVFVSDTGTSAIYTLPAGGDRLSVFIEPGRLASPGGIAISSDAKTLFIADYRQGIARVDRARREVTFLAPPEHATLVGIDGLRFHEGALIAIQNGIQPHRVVRLALTPDGAAVREAVILEMSHPLFNEPTLGVILGQDFWYIANSQWGSFDKGGVIWPADRLKDPVILKMRLD
jgi:sugar lactone lactonase YvrE